jgi:hypothetical protein
MKYPRSAVARFEFGPIDADLDPTERRRTISPIGGLGIIYTFMTQTIDYMRIYNRVVHDACSRFAIWRSITYQRLF